MGQIATGGLRTNQRAYQHCFIGHSQGAPWRETFEQVCEEVLPHFGLKPWYADKHYQGTVPLRQKVVDMIATTRYGIYDLSYWRTNDQSVWTMPRNVLIELGMAIALNRPMLLLRHGKNRECGLALPACLEGIEIGEFGDGKKLLRETLHKCLPSLTQHTPQQDWLNRYCHFGALQCSYRETHPQAKHWGRQKIHIHISDGANAAHIDCSDFRDMIEEDVINRFNNLEINYLDSLACPQGCKFLLCSRCQEVRSSPFAIYRITPHTSADTFIAIGMSISLEKQFNYAIPKILITEDADTIPSLLKGYEIIVERNYMKIKDRLNAILPEIIEEMKQSTWKPQPLPFEVFLPEKEILKQEKEVVGQEEGSFLKDPPVVEDLPVKEEAPMDMDYERGLEQLKQHLQGTDWIQAFLVYEARLRENLRQDQLYGPNEQSRSDRANIVELLNFLARQVNISFVEQTPENRLIGISIDVRTRQVWLDGQLLSHALAPLEFRLLSYLVEHVGLVCQQKDLIRELYNDDHYTNKNDQRIYALLARLRRALGENAHQPRYLITHHGGGVQLLRGRIIETDRKDESQESVMDILFKSEGISHLSEAVLINAYKEVQDGRITDPSTIHRIAAKFEQVAKDPRYSATVSFDVSSAALNLYEQARRLEELFEESTSNPPFSDKPNSRAISIFMAYSHKDKRFLEKLKTHMFPLQRQGLVNMWHDRDISAGTEWESEINRQLNAADLILLLVSADFLVSEYCSSKEMRWAMERHERGEARVIPIILRPCDWKDAPFGRLQALPMDARPVASWRNTDEAFLNVAEGIYRALENLQNRP